MIRLTTPQPPEKLSAETRPSRQCKLQGCSRRAKPRLAGKYPGMKKEKATEWRSNVEGSLGLPALRHDALRHAADAALLASQRKSRLGMPGCWSCSEVIEEENRKGNIHLWVRFVRKSPELKWLIQSENWAGRGYARLAACGPAPLAFVPVCVCVCVSLTPCARPRRRKQKKKEEIKFCRCAERFFQPPPFNFLHFLSPPSSSSSPKPTIPPQKSLWFRTFSCAHTHTV